MEESADIRKAAVEAVYGRDGRGLIGRDRASLTDRVYRALEQERARSAQAARDYLAAEFMPAFGSLPDDLAAAILAAPPVGG